jgi:alkaline phosphatase
MTSLGRATTRACARLGFFCLLLAALTAQAAGKAKNVILFLADGASLATVSAASIYGYGEPLSLYVQRMPHTGLSETSAASQWVSDSAAGMTAIVTGQKTHNGVISQSASAVRGEKDGEPLKTILEYAEENGLSTGVISNSSMADATPAACYAHVNDRAKQGEIFLQLLEPRFGDGVDVVIGYGRDGILKNTAALGADLPARLREKGYAYFETLESLSALKPSDDRVVALFNDDDFDLSAAVGHAIRILSRNPRGFFLMVESNTHGGDPKRNLDRMVAFDNIIHRTAEAHRYDTLILFTADHAHDQRLVRGLRGEDILPHIRVEGGAHTGEEVLASAEGPGSEAVKGLFPNTRLFHVMMNAFGWTPGDK